MVLRKRDCSLISKSSPIEVSVKHWLSWAYGFIIVTLLESWFCLFSLFFFFPSPFLSPSSSPSPPKPKWFPDIFCQTKEELPLNYYILFDLFDFFHLSLPANLLFDAARRHKVTAATGNEWFHSVVQVGCGAQFHFSSMLLVFLLVLLIITAMCITQVWEPEAGPHFRLELFKNTWTPQNT